MNKKYIKFGFLGIFVIFVIFVIVRKISVDSQSNQVKVQNVDSKKVSEVKKEIDPRKKLMISENKKSPNLEIVEKKIENNKLLVTSELKEKEISNDLMDKTIKVVNENSKKNELRKVNLKKEIEILKNKMITAKTQVLEKKEKDINMVTPNTNIEKITTIDKLKEIKESILIDVDKKIFLFNQRTFTLNDKFGKFTIVKIKPKKIRFKKGELFYSLRFY